MKHRVTVLRVALSTVLLTAFIVMCTAGSACALSSVSGRVEIWGSPGTALPGVRVEVFTAEDLWLDVPVRTVLGSAIVDVNGDYTVANLPNDTLVIIAFEDLTGVYRDFVYRSSGVPLEYSGAYLTPTDGVMSGVHAWLLTLENLAEVRIARPYGSDRYGTSAAISRSYFGAADTVIIASGAGFADALSAAPLAGAYDAPILLTKPTSLPDAIGDEIERLGATNAYIIGSTSAVSEGVRSQLTARGITSITRLGGANRYATAEKVIYELPAEYFEGGTMPFVCRGDSFADALSVSPLSTYWGVPILLTAPTKLPVESARAWKYMTDRGSDTVSLIGSTAAIRDSVLDDLLDNMSGDLNYYRFFGANRYETSAVIAEAFGPWDTLGLASGTNFPDALSGGAAVGRWGGTLVLTTPTRLHYAARSTLEENGPYSIDLEALGSTAALSSGTFTSAINALGTDFYDVDAPSGLVSLTGLTPLGCFREQASDAKSADVRPASTGPDRAGRRDFPTLPTQVWSAK